MADFFEHQERARRATRMIIPLFVLAILGTVVAVAAVATVPANLANLYHLSNERQDYETQRRRAEASQERRERSRQDGTHQGLSIHAETVVPMPEDPGEWQWSWWWPRLWTWTTLLSLLVIVMSALQKRNELAGGGGRVAELVGGRRVDPTDDEPVDEEGLSPRELVNVVEEMAVASGLPVPRIYLLPRENSINGFAGGMRPDDACIAVTRGALRYLTRDELQAVVAHEFSHILHGDTRLNQRMIIAVFGVGGIGMIGTAILRQMLEPDDENGMAGLAHPVFWGIMVAAMTLAAIGSIGTGAARLLQATCNRHREYLADAAAVQFTRNPAGLTGALKKIGGYRRKGRLLNLHASEIAHLCIAPSSFQMIDTHPPLPERIIRFDREFDGTFERIGGDDPELTKRLTATENRVRREWQRERDTAESRRMAEVMLAGGLLASAGRVTPQGMHAARHLLDALPAELREAAHEPDGAKALVLAMVADSDVETRCRELEIIAETAPEVAERTRTLCEQTSGLDARHRLPLLDLALPTLQDLDLESRVSFLDLLRRAIDADAQQTLLELCYRKIAEHALAPRPTVSRARQVYSVQGYAEALAPVFSALANQNVNPDRAYQIACEKLRIRRICDRMPSPAPEELDRGFDMLLTAPRPIQKRILDAAATCVATDAVIEPAEHELLRALAATMNVPLPPAVEAASLTAAS